MLGSHIARGAGDLGVVGFTQWINLARKSEVGDVRCLLLVQQHIGRLQVQVQHVQTVRIGHRFGNGAQQRCGAARFEGAIRRQRRRQAAAPHQAHAEKVQIFRGANFVHGDDVGVLHPRRVTRLVQKPLDELV